MGFNKTRKTTWFVSIGITLLGGIFSNLAAREFPHQAKVVNLENLTHNVKRITLQPQDPTTFTFTPGQHVFLKASDEYLAEFKARYPTGRTHTYRPYSCASSPSDPSQFDLIVKHYTAPPDKDVPPGIVSTYIHEHLRVGDMVELSDPGGNLYTESDEQSDRPIVVVAGGVGASPFVGLLNYWFEQEINLKREIYFFLGVRSARDLLLHEQFSQWVKTKKNFHYIPALSDPQDEDNWQGATGYINVVLDKYFKESLDADVYMAGPPIMIRFTRKVLDAKGVNSGQIHRDPIRVR